MRRNAHRAAGGDASARRLTSSATAPAGSAGLVAPHSPDLGAARLRRHFGCFGAGGALGRCSSAAARARVARTGWWHFAAISLAAALAALSDVRCRRSGSTGDGLAGAGSSWRSRRSPWPRSRSCRTGSAARAALHAHLPGAMAVGSAFWRAMAAIAALHRADRRGGGVVTVHVVARRWAAAERGRSRRSAPAHWSEPSSWSSRSRSTARSWSRSSTASRTRTPQFLEAMRDLRRTRSRDGARRWSVYRPLRPERHVESFAGRSWADTSAPTSAACSRIARRSSASSLCIGATPRVPSSRARFRRSRGARPST